MIRKKNNKAPKKIKVFIGLSEVTGYYKGLKNGFDQLGIRANFINLDIHPFNYGGDNENVFIKILKYFLKRYNQTQHKKISAHLWRSLSILFRVIIFLWAFFTHNVFIFGFRSSFLRFHELPILKFFRKKIIYVFHGSDSRPPYLDGSIISENEHAHWEYYINLTKKIKKQIRIIEQYADVIINTPTQGHFHERPFVLFSSIGTPIQIPQFSNKKKTSSEKKNIRETKILHAPSDPQAKGTNLIRKAIKNLKLKGMNIHFVQITNQPNRVICDELDNCDFVVDQLYSDYLLPGLATEAAWFGKPTILGGYAKKLWEELLTPDQTPPVFYCHPSQIEQAIEKMIVDEEYRLTLGRKAQTFIKEYWHPKKVAERYLQLMKGCEPQVWWYDPKKIRYVHGVCLSESRVKQIVKSIIELGGKEALQLKDKPELEQLLIQFSLSK